MLAKKVDDHLEAVEKYEQVSRCNCLLMHQISEKKQENTVKLVQSNKWTPIFESLTATYMKKLNEAWEKYNFKSFRTSDRKVLF